MSDLPFVSSERLLSDHGHLLVTAGSHNVLQSALSQVLADESGLIILSARNHSFTGHASCIRLTPGQFGNGSGFSVNPLELIAGIDLHQHVAELTDLFSEVFAFSDVVRAAFKETLLETYSHYGWNPDGKNSRCPEVKDGNHFQPEAFPVLSDLITWAESATTKTGLSAYECSDVAAAIRYRLQSLVRGRNKFIFASRTNVSIAHVFQSACAIDLSSLDGRERALIAGLLICFLKELGLAGSITRKTLLIIEHIEDMAEIARVCSKPQSYLSARLSHLAECNVKVVATCDPDGMKGVDTTGFHTTVSRETTTLPLEIKRGRGKLKGKESNLVLRHDDVPYALLMQKNSQSKTRALSSPPRRRRSKKMRVAIEPWISAGSEYYSEPFCNTEIVYEGLRIAGDDLFYARYLGYFLSTRLDLTQLVHNRVVVIHEVQRLTGRKKLNVAHVAWVALCVATDRYFFQEGRFQNWTLEEEHAQRSAWYEMLYPAFVPTAPRRLQMATLKKWREDLANLQVRDQGPLPNCASCTVKCRYGCAVSQLTKDAGLCNDFNFSLNRKNIVASESAAWICRLFVERFAQMADPSLSFCFAVHLINKQKLSTDAQGLLMFEIRKALKFDEFPGTPPDPITSQLVAQILDHREKQNQDQQQEQKQEPGETNQETRS